LQTGFQRRPQWRGSECHWHAEILAVCSSSGGLKRVEKQADGDTEPPMKVVLFVHLLALAFWLGEIAAFSFVVAPALFTALGPATAGEAVAAIFPRYYALGAGAAAVALLGALLLARAAASPGWWTAGAMSVALGLAATVWAAAIVHPRAEQLRVALHAAGRVPAESADFRHAHRLAVALNGVALVAAIAGLGFSAATTRP
jgi:uncharacterized protein DUF4149